MDPIPEGLVEKTWKRMAELPDEEAAPLAMRIREEQPAVVAYLMAVDQDLLNQPEREILFYMGMVIWQIMSAAGKQLSIALQDVERADDANTDVLLALMKEDETGLQAAARDLVNNYPQSAVLKYAVEALVQAAEEGEVRADNIGMLMIDLKTVIDCFDRSSSILPPAA